MEGLGVSELPQHACIKCAAEGSSSGKCGSSSLTWGALKIKLWPKKLLLTAVESENRKPEIYLQGDCALRKIHQDSVNQFIHEEVMS